MLLDVVKKKKKKKTDEKERDYISKKNGEIDTKKKVYDWGERKEVQGKRNRK